MSVCVCLLLAQTSSPTTTLILILNRYSTLSRLGYARGEKDAPLNKKVEKENIVAKINNNYLILL